MELLKQKITSYRPDGISRGVSEETADAVIPDRLPDAARVVFTDAELTLSDADESDGECVIVGGTARVTALCCGEDGSLNPISANIPFSVKLEKRSSDGKRFVRACVKSADARLLNSRKLTFRVAVLAACDSVSPFEAELVTGSSGDDNMCLRLSSSDVWATTAVASRRFTVSDDLELPSGKPDAEAVVSARVRLREAEHKRVTGKLVAKCDAELDVVYITPDGKLATAEFTLPFSQILEADGVEEDSEARLELAPRSVEVETMGEGQSRLLRASVRAEAFMRASERRTIEYASDAYSLAYDTVIDRASLPVVSDISTQFGEIELKEKLPCEAPPAEIVSVRASALPPTVSASAGGKSDVSSVVAVKCVYLTPDGAAYGVSKNFTADWSAAAGPDDELSARAELASAQAVVSDGSIELRAKVDFAADSARRSAISAITSLSNGEVKKRPADAPTFILRAAKAGDDLYELAKSYNTTASAICSANSFEGDSVPADGMVLIPV